MNSRVDRSLASIPRRTFLKTAALAGVSPLAFTQANQDKDKHKNGRIFVFVNERDMSPEPTDPAMTGMFAIDPESGVWERVASPKETAVGLFSSISPNDGAIAACAADPAERGCLDLRAGKRQGIETNHRQKNRFVHRSFVVLGRTAIARQLQDQGSRERSGIGDIHISSRRDGARKTRRSPKPTMRLRGLPTTVPSWSRPVRINRGR